MWMEGLAAGEHRHHDREKVAALRREHVFVPLWFFVIEAPLEELLFREVLQATGQNVRSDSQASLEFFKSGTALKCIAQNKNAPPFANGLQCPCGGAFCLRLLLWMHDSES